jgi:hypothetical protein
MRRSLLPWMILAPACDPGLLPEDDDLPPDDTEPSQPPAPDDTDDGPPLGPPVEVTLRVPTADPPEIRLDLDRDAVAELFGPAASEIVLLELDPMPLLTAALGQIKEACGTAWRRDVPRPTYDCALTELGRSFRGPDGTWRTSPELALIRILTMTPANADVDGTSIATLAGIADWLGLGGGFGQILSDSLAIARTEEFLDTEAVAQSLQATLLATHPAVNAAGRIPVTLEDALTDLRTLGERLGPSGAHPGVVDPSGPTYGRVLGDAFAMRAAVRSNLRVLDGLDLDVGKDYLGLVVDRTGPTWDDEVEFDFTDPSRFDIVGVVERPVLDLRFGVRENPRFVPACTGVAAGADCRRNLPGAPVGARTVWTTPAWEIEHVIGRAGLIKYGALRTQRCYLGCGFVEVSIGRAQDPAGFARFDVLLSIGDPPGPQYAWELIDEVAQVRLHDGPAGRIAEGAANVAFTLRDVPVGLTAAGITAAVRPVLQRQNTLVSDFLLGDFRKNSGPVDLYWQRTEDGQPTLFFVSDADHGERPRSYARPGLFADARLREKVSATRLPGATDTTREKWRPPGGDSVVFAQDDGGRTFRLDVIADDLTAPDAEITVIVREVLR